VKKIDELACVAGNLAPDIILITESWCNSDITDAFLSFDGYELQTELRLDRQDTTQGRGGGLLVYVREGVKILSCDRKINFHQYCKLLVSDVTLYLIYRSPNSPAQSLLDLEQLIRGAEKNSLFIGDFNMPDIDWETGHSSARARPFVEAVEDCMMEQMVNFSTQVKGNCLDLVITNIPERVSEVVEAGRLGRSDHDMLCITLEMENRTDGPVKQTTNWKRADWQSMRADLATVDWTSEMMAKNAEEMWNGFKNAYKKHRETMVENAQDG
jgi:hypothetical protein